MRTRPRLGTGEWVAIALIVVGVGLAIWSGPNLDTAVPSAALAILGGLLLAAIGLQSRIRSRRVALDTPEADPMVGLAAAFGEGSLGRAEIVAQVRGLSRELRHLDPGPMSLEEEIRLLASSPAGFRAWVERQVAVLEQET